MSTRRVVRCLVSFVLRLSIVPIFVFSAMCTAPIPGRVLDVASTPEQPVPDPSAAWTVIVYLAADNELEPYAEYELTRLTSATYSPDIAVVLLVDRRAHAGASASTRLYAAARGGAGARPPVRIGSTCLGVPDVADVKLNTGDGATLSSFVACAMSMFPAERYMLYLWGYGLRPHASSARTVGYSDTFGVGLDARTVRRALANTPVSIVAFDGPRTALIEVAYELRDSAAVLLAAQDSVSANGWPIANLLEAMTETEMRVDDVASVAVHARERAEHHPLSVIRTPGIHRLHETFNALSFEAYAAVTTNAVRSSIRTSLFHHPDAVYSRPGELDIDLSSVAHVMSEIGVITATRADDLNTALDAAVSHGPFDNEPRLSGLSVHFIGVDEFGYAAPHDAAYFAYDSPEDTGSFFATSSWVPHYPTGPGLLYRLWYEVLP